ncbi:DUF5946 family protein [Roseisolibacter sp. H3M3-2]|uniref:DUF5946 family protein n=1 Tax=Roseisolibacter sp. H3M3-2 TaxID=3031323 RepID=UPI0023DC90E8|nr:DUF5946 family protein [Roseisolibacter sp. H3M3-2]MDF1505048.1 DUF5946 family protein [Roseisolibacter sp. H3M3-2]
MPPAPPAPCPGCGALFPPSDGPTHRYIGASAGCWALFAPRSVGEAPDPALLAASRVPEAPSAARPAPFPPAPALATLVADAYAAQHHGDDSPPAVQSVAVHLLVLHGVARRGVAPARAQWVRTRALRTRGVFAKLAPPPVGAALTLRHLYPGGGVTTPAAPADYAASVLAAWEGAHAATLRAWYDRHVVAD